MRLSTAIHLTAFVLLISVAGCGESTWRPTARVEQIVDDHASHQVTILVMTPRYDIISQIRRGNMGHVALAVDGRLHDVGSLDGFAYTFSASTAGRCWPFARVDDAIAAIRDRPDCDGELDELTRFDINATPREAAALRTWWRQIEQRIASEPGNRLYHWSGLQCATAVGEGLKFAGITDFVPASPLDLKEYCQHHLRSSDGKPAVETVIQAGHGPARGEEHPLLAVLTHLPSAMTAGNRTQLSARDPDGNISQILWSDGAAYRQRVKTLGVSPESAVASSGVADSQNVPNFMIGHWYHIASDHITGQASLGGMYINGDDGARRTLNSTQVVRFDSLFGDTIK